MSIERKDLLAINQIGWNVVAPQFYGGTALPNYGPLSITEQELQLLVLERLIESELNIDLAREKDYLPEKWYSVPRAKLIPTTFVIKARRPT